MRPTYAEKLADRYKGKPFALTVEQFDCEAKLGNWTPVSVFYCVRRREAICSNGTDLPSADSFEIFKFGEQ